MKKFQRPPSILVHIWTKLQSLIIFEQWKFKTQKVTNQTLQILYYLLFILVIQTQNPVNPVKLN